MERFLRVPNLIWIYYETDHQGPGSGTLFWLMHVWALRHEIYLGGILFYLNLSHAETDHIHDCSAIEDTRPEDCLIPSDNDVPDLDNTAVSDSTDRHQALQERESDHQECHGDRTGEGPVHEVYREQFIEPGTLLNRSYSSESVKSFITRIDSFFLIIQ